MSSNSFKKLAKEINGDEDLGSYFLIWVVALGVAALIVWATLTELDNVTRGSGKVVSSGQNILIQAQESGVVTHVGVEENDLVEVGQLLFEIDPTETKSQLAQAKQRMNMLDIQSTRLEAQASNSPLKYDPDVILQDTEAVNAQINLYQAQLLEVNTSLSILEKQKSQTRNELNELAATLQSLQLTSELIIEEINTVQPLVDSGLAPATRILSLKRERQQALGEIERIVATKVTIDERLNELAERTQAVTQKFQKEALSSLAVIASDMAELKEKVPALEARVARTSITAQGSAIVNRLIYRNVGAFVKSGENLMELVPVGDTLVVEGMIDPKDRGEIILGDVVKVALTAYDQQRYGRIEGRITSISADAITTTADSSQFYKVTASLDTQLVEDDGSFVNIMPGMIAQIDIVTGKKSLIQYFWAPVSRMKDSAFRD